MRRFVLFAVLLVAVCLPVSSQAVSHHRGHTMMFLESALEEIDSALFWARSYRDRDAAGLLPPDQKQVYDGILAQYKIDGTCEFHNLSRPVGFCIANWIGQMRATYPKADFPEFNVAYDHIFMSNKYDIYVSKYRNLVQEYRDGVAAGLPLPDLRGTIHSSGMGEGNKESGLWGFVHSESNVSGLIRADSPNLKKVRRIALVHRNAVGELVFALWHHYDGTFDEVYNDPEFICSGPGNPCE